MREREERNARAIITCRKESGDPVHAASDSGAALSSWQMHDMNDDDRWLMLGSIAVRLVLLLRVVSDSVVSSNSTPGPNG